MGNLVYMFGFIDGEMSKQLIAELIEASQKHKQITMLINSQGGEVVEALAIYDAISMLKAPVDALVLGQCSSAASYVLQACRNRYMTPNSRFMIHEGTDFLGRNAAKEMPQIVADSAEIDKACVNILARRSGRSPLQITKLRSPGAYLSAPQAIKLGFADQIIKRLKDAPPHESPRRI
jgi:ATP-dependent Clp protease protease subunit